MRNQIEEALTVAVNSQPSSVESSYNSGLSYVEWAEVPVQETNEIEQLQKNLAQLEDIRHRLSFMMREIRYMMKA